jgi:hypothetical protein
VTGFRLHFVNLTSDEFLAADNDFQQAVLNNIALFIDIYTPIGRKLFDSLQQKASEDFLTFLKQ